MRNAGWGRAPFRTWLRESARTVLWPRHGPGRAPGGAAVLFDLRTALQSLRRAPGFTLIVVVTLGLGVGANTAMFGVLNGLLLRPAPYADSGRLDRIFRATPQDPRGGVSPADYLDLRSEISGYGQVAAYAYSDVCLSEPGRPAEMVSGLRISANLLSTLATQPRLGRTFRANDELAGNHRVLILSHRYWQRRFGGESDVVGRGVRVGGELHEIVGVLPDDFSDWRHLGSVDVFKPLGLTPEETRDRSSTTLNLIGRRSSSVSRAQADALIAIFGRRLAAQHAALHSESSWRTVPLDDSVVPENRRRLLGLLVGLSGFVLLIACSNLANLTLSRTVARARELAVRSALGASRSRTLRPLLFESLLLALAGGLGAVFVARLTFDWLTAEGGIVLTFDWRVLGWAFGASLLTVVAFAAAPALFLQRLDLNRTLQSGSRGMAGALGHRRFRQLLVVGQYALATVLLAGAALSLRGLDELRSRHTGWRSERLITGSILLPAAPYPGPRDIAEFRELAVRRVETLPGVVSASTSDSLPFLGPAETRRAVIAGRAASEAGREAAVRLNAVSAHHFETVGTRLLGGRSFDDGDTPTSPRVFIINQAMARGVFAGESPLGRRLALAGGDAREWGEVVGVAADVQSVSPDPSTISYQLYRPVAQQPRRLFALAVRTAASAPSALADGIRATMMSLDPDLPVQRLEAAEVTVDQASRPWLVLSRILSSLSLLGLGLASLGLYGVVSRTVAQRTCEFGLRLAIGARPVDIVRLVLVSGARLAVAGSAVGLLGALGISRILSALLPGMQTNGVPVLCGITLLLVGVALIASYWPARSASQTNVTETLRSE